MGMDITLIAAAIAVVLVAVIVTYLVMTHRANKQITEFKSLSEAVNETAKALANIRGRVSEEEQRLHQIDSETKALQALKANADKLEASVRSNTDLLGSLESQIGDKKSKLATTEKALHDLMAKLDLYTRVDELVEYGHFEMPQYLYETSARFAEEIKRIREDQKELIRSKKAVEYPNKIGLSSDPNYDRRVLEGQAKLMLSAFNVECDMLIGNANPGNYARTLERIEKLANTLEKHLASLHCGFNIKYVEMKFQECTLQYQFALKKQEEQEEQRLIREQMREEQKAIKEYERAVAEAEKEEKMYRDLLERAREELGKASEEERLAAEQRIADLEQQLAVAEAKEQRAKSMAEMTRRGHVYVISNIGSFGNNVYKIGLTRRLDPMERVKELGDASVPFSFDVHAMIYTDDAPALEAALHREFTDRRVNAVNLRKEFFKTDLVSIKEAAEKIVGPELDFLTTIAAEEYYESLRLQKAPEITEPEAIFAQRALAGDW